MERLLRDGALSQRDRKRVHELIEQSRAAGHQNPSVRPHVEALLSAVFAYLDLPQQRSIVHSWIDRGTRGAAARWPKAVAQVPAHFDEAEVMAYFSSSEDERSARRLADQASPAFLADNLVELVRRCEAGWIVSRAAMRARSVRDDAWQAIRCRHPASYLYLCARLHRKVSEEEALQLVLTCPNSIMDQKRGLAIWAVGQMGTVNVLDEIAGRGDELLRRDLDAFNQFPD